MIGKLKPDAIAIEELFFNTNITTGIAVAHGRGVLLCAAERVVSGETDLSDIAAHKSYDYTVSELKKIKGVGDKVAACAALFGFGNLEAFPIDVWMRRAIDTYFDGELDYVSLGEYRGVAQQYIFHYIRNLEGQSN